MTLNTKSCDASSWSDVMRIEIRPQRGHAKTEGRVRWITRRVFLRLLPILVSPARLLSEVDKVASHVFFGELGKNNKFSAEMVFFSFIFQSR